eukprot:gene12312-2247_t
MNKPYVSRNEKSAMCRATPKGGLAVGQMRSAITYGTATSKATWSIGELMLSVHECKVVLRKECSPELEGNPSTRLPHLRGARGNPDVSTIGLMFGASATLGYMCPACLELYDSATASRYHLRCTQCFRCPVCAAIAVLYSTGQGTDKTAHWVCNMCNWDSLSVGLSDPSPSALEWQVAQHHGLHPWLSSAEQTQTALRSKAQPCLASSFGTSPSASLHP